MTAYTANRPPRRTRRNRDLLDRQEVERYEERTRWIAAEHRAQELRDHVRSIQVRYTLAPDLDECRLTHNYNPEEWAIVFRAAPTNDVDTARTQTSLNNPHPPRAFELAVEAYLAAKRRAS